MCDIASIKCAGCQTRAELHIGDFSVSPEHITSWCPKCQQRMLQWLCDNTFGQNEWIVFADNVFPNHSGHAEGIWFFIVDYPRDIHLNTNYINGDDPMEFDEEDEEDDYEDEDDEVVDDEPAEGDNGPS